MPLEYAFVVCCRIVSSIHSDEMKGTKTLKIAELFAKA
jgi:hypothetical protein